MYTYDHLYEPAFAEKTLTSAKAMVPLVMELVHPRSVVDVGCGHGVWLSVFREEGVSDILGIDADWVKREALRIPEEKFMPRDLAQPIRLDREYDLVVSLEVAEHLPAQYAAAFVESLSRLGPVVLFSAAIPFQGGNFHVNEQWPDYWAQLFRGHGYVVADCLRRKLWQNGEVAVWYAQNTLLFIRENHLKKYPLLEQEAARTDSALSIVHPHTYFNAKKRFYPEDVTLMQVLKVLPYLFWRAFALRLRRLFRRPSDTGLGGQ